MYSMLKAVVLADGIAVAEKEARQADWKMRRRLEIEELRSA